MRVGDLLLNDGVSNGERVLPEGWVETMTTSSPRNPNYGMHIWLGREYVPVRPYSEIHPVGVPHAEPFLSDDLYFIEGGGYRTLYVVPSEGLLILRLGKSNPDWDSSYLPNRLVEGLREENETP